MGPAETIIVLLAGCLACLGYLSTRTARPDLFPRLARAAGRLVGRFWLPLALFFVPIFLASMTMRPDDAVLVFWGIAAVIGLLIAWVREFSFLMRLSDDAFPGRNDKLIWALVLVVLPPLGVLAFWSFRRAHWSPIKPFATDPAHDLA